MKLASELIRTTKLLSEYPGQWALCGGVAASIYRTKPRFTDDIDIALIDSPRISARDLATKAIKDLGYREYLGFVPDASNGNEQILGLVCARGTDDPRFAGLDFLLPVQFWIASGVKFAQANVIDFGFAEIPTITPESLILAKIASVTASPERFQDLDDLKELVASVTIDFDFIATQLEEAHISIPPEVRALVFRGKRA